MDRATMLSERERRADGRSHASRPATEVETVPAPRAPRDPWLDNARFVAATLILLVHFLRWGGPGDGTAVDLLNYGTWPMRLPVYVLIAGYFSSAAPLQGRRGAALLRNVLFVYLAFEMLTTVHTWAITGDLTFDPARPTFALWFLLSLFLWRLTLPLVADLRFLLPIAFAASAVATLVPSLGMELAAGRTVAFWPIFVLGWRLKQIGLRRVLDRRAVRAGAAVFLSAWLVFCCLNAETLRARWFSMAKHYSGTMAEELTETAIRVGVLGLAAVGGLATLALIPRRRLWAITYLGSGSLYIYLLHPFVLREVQRGDHLAWVDTLPEIVLVIGGGLALACVLGSPLVRHLLRWLVQPRYTWPFGATTAATWSDTQRTNERHSAR